MKKLLSLLALFLLFSCGSLDNPGTANREIPVDPAVTIGKLENGLTYYIRENRKPEHRAQLWLAVKAGSVLEDEDQKGLAHLLEHMAFNGTEKYPKQEIINYLESIGMKFGPEINAYTGFDQTVYMIQVPADDEEKLAMGLDILSQWAFHIQLDPGEVDKERGVVIEEWRLGRGAGSRLLDMHFPTLMKDSRYASRLPIGDPEVVKNFDYPVLKRFYKDWYRPELMGVIVTGDIDKTHIEQMIKASFSTPGARENPRPREQFPIPFHKETLYTIATDPETQYITFEMYEKLPAVEKQDFASYTTRIKENLVQQMLSQRLQEKVNAPDSPLVYASPGETRFIQPMRNRLLFWVAKPEREKESCALIFEELEKVKRFGFTPGELERAKAELLSLFKTAYNERNTTDTSQYMQKYLDHFLYGMEIPGIEWKYNLINEYLPPLTLDEIEQHSKNFFSGSQVFMVSAPDQQADALPGVEELKALARETAEKKLEAVVDNFEDRPLITRPLKGGPVTRENYYASVNVTEWVLENGVRVILKPTDFKADEVLIAAFSPGGISRVENEDFLSSLLAVDTVTQGGLGDFTRNELQKKLAGKQVYVEPYISGITEGFRGASAPGDLETAFQMIYLYFTGTNLYHEGVANYIEQLKGMLINRANDPEAYFEETFNYLLHNKHFRARPLSRKILEEIRIPRAYEIYKDRFMDAGDFTFVFTGNFTLETIKPLVETYLGALPAGGREESWIDREENSITTVVTENLFMGSEPKSYVGLAFPGEYTWDSRTNSLIEALEQIIKISLREVIREEESGTYGVRVNLSYSRYPKQEYLLQLTFGCSPDRAEELTARTLEVLEKLKTEIPGEKIVKVKETRRKEYEQLLEENTFWLTALKDAFFYGVDPSKISDYEEEINNITPEALEALAREIINQDRYLKVILYPKQAE